MVLDYFTNLKNGETVKNQFFEYYNFDFRGEQMACHTHSADCMRLPTLEELRNQKPYQSMVTTMWLTMF